MCATFTVQVRVLKGSRGSPELHSSSYTDKGWAGCCMSVKLCSLAQTLDGELQKVLAPWRRGC